MMDDLLDEGIRSTGIVREPHRPPEGGPPPHKYGGRDCEMVRNDREGKKAPSVGFADSSLERGSRESTGERWVTAGAGFLGRVRLAGPWAALFGGAAGVAYWWQTQGLMDHGTALAMMLVCTAALGWKLGRCL